MYPTPIPSSFYSHPIVNILAPTFRETGRNCYLNLELNKFFSWVSKYITWISNTSKKLLNSLRSAFNTTSKNIIGDIPVQYLLILLQSEIRLVEVDFLLGPPWFLPLIEPHHKIRFIKSFTKFTQQTAQSTKHNYL